MLLLAARNDVLPKQQSYLMKSQSEPLLGKIFVKTETEQESNTARKPNCEQHGVNLQVTTVYIASLPPNQQQPDNHIVFWNSSCSLAVQDDPNSSLQHLEITFQVPS